MLYGFVLKDNRFGITNCMYNSCIHAAGDNNVAVSLIYIAEYILGSKFASLLIVLVSP